MLTIILVISLASLVQALPSTVGSLSHNGKLHQYHFKRSITGVHASNVGMVMNHDITRIGSNDVLASQVPIPSSAVSKTLRARPLNIPPPIPAPSNSKISTPYRGGTTRVDERSGINRIKYMASLSSLCYENILKPTESLKGMVILTVIKECGYLAYIAIDKSSKDLILSFRGAIGQLKWIDSLQLDTVSWQFPPSQTEGVKIHRGYSQIWNLLRTRIYWALETPVIHHHITKLYPDSKVIITGHSVGGAVASIAAMDLVNRGLVRANKIELTTFGSPQVGNAEYARSMNQMGFQSVIRIINEDDSVPYFPGAILGYTRFNGEHHIVGGKVVVLNDMITPSSVPFPFPPNKAHFGLFGKDGVFGDT